MLTGWSVVYNFAVRTEVINVEKLLMLGTGMHTVEMVQYARSLGVYTIVTDYLEPADSVGKQYSDEYWMISSADVDTLERRCRAEGVTAVACGTSEFNLERTMELCGRLGFPCYCTPESWHYSRDKADFKELCRREGVPMAEDYALSERFTEEELNKIQFPVVVKPVDMCGNRGVSYCYNREDLIKGYQNARAMSDSSKIIVEHMFTGREWYAYYAMAEGEIRQICLNDMIAQPGELKNLYSITTPVTDNVERIMTEINPAIKRALKAVGCREGIAWVELMQDTDDQFYVIEMGYRLPGDIVDKTYQYLFGFDPTKWIVDYALGHRLTVQDLPAEQEHAYSRCSCGYLLWANRSGTISEMTGFDEINRIPGVECVLLKHRGDSFALHSMLETIAIVADTVDEMCEKIAEINRYIHILDENGEDAFIKFTDFDTLKRNGRNRNAGV